MRLKSFAIKNFKVHNYWLIPPLIGLIFILVGLKFKFLDFAIFVQISIFVALLWYSFETRELRIVTQKQLEPILFLYLDRSDKYLELSNIGKTPISNLFIAPILLGDDEFEFNLLKPISHIIPGEKYKIEITKSHGLTRYFNQEVGSLRSAMQTIDIKKIELVMAYDTNFQINEKVKFVFEIPGRLPDPKDPIRECKIYLLPE